jgi:hypothetical protein
MYLIDKALNIIYLQQGWCSPAKIDSFQRLRAQVVLLHLQLCEHSAEYLILEFQRCGEMEIAISASPPAKRNMDIDTGH